MDISLTVDNDANVVSLPIKARVKSGVPRSMSDFDSYELLKALPAAVYTADAVGRITFYNDAAVALWGCRPELGKSEWCGARGVYTGRTAGRCRMASAPWR